MSGDAISGDDVTRAISESNATLAGARSGDAASIVEPGRSIGRYVVLEEVGRGAMGVVLRTYDPKLQREVALKVVRADSADTEARLVREARAMAQLAHPNVVALYDAALEPIPEGIHGGTRMQVVLAMEYVPGVDLRRWLSSESRRPEEILEVFVEAGRGLMAAHRGGLLHRDFKPDNVLVGQDGRVRVTDFGLVRAENERESGGPSESVSEGSPDVSDDLTRVGTVLGTPRYMAPEQHRGMPLTAAADQYAFCVALWEALHGAPPFPSAKSLLRDKLEGPPPWPRGSGVLARVAGAVRRGLSPDPGDRFPSMDALLAVLGRRPNRVWRGRAVLLVTGAMAGAIAWTSLVRSEDLCTGAEAQLAGVWDRARREVVASGFTDESVSFAPAVWERLEPRIDAWAEAWTTMYEESCEATRIRGEQSEALMDLRIACLQRARTQLKAAVDVLGDATPAVVEHAHEVVNGLPSLQRCADAESLRAEVPVPEPADAETVQGLRADIADARARRRAGDYEAALVSARSAAEASENVSYAPIRTETLVELGAAYRASGRYDEAEAALREAVHEGTRWRQWDEVRTATRTLVRVLGYEKARHAEALALREVLLGLSKDAPQTEALARDTIAMVLARMGKHEEAEAEHRAVLELQRSALDPEHPEIATSRNNLGNVLYEQGRYAEAEAEYRAAFEVRRRGLGPDHPEIAAARNNLGLVLQAQGKYEEAAQEHRAALEVRTAALGPEHPSVAASHNNLAMVLQLQGELEEAETRYRAALEIWRGTMGPDHPNVARVRANLGTILSSTDRHAEAEQEHRGALEVQMKSLGAEHPDIASARHNLAIALRGQGRYEEAEAEFRAVLVHRVAALGEEHPEVASSRNGLANVLLEQGKLAEAESELRTALVQWTAALGPEHPAVGTAHQNLAAVLEKRGKDDEAEKHHRSALEVRLAALGPEHAEVAESFRALGQLLMRHGRRDEAESLIERARTIEGALRDPGR